MLGIIFSFCAGLLVSLQGVFNTRVSDKVGLWETTAIVHGVGFVLAIVIMFFWGDGSFRKIEAVNSLYLLGGAFGVIIVYSVMKGISLIGTTFSISILLITQLLFATVIDYFGLFGSPQMKFDFTKPLGIIVIMLGIVIFKIRG